MTWTPPLPVLRVALSLGPYDDTTSPDWTDLSDRVLSWSIKRGRGGDILEPFQPGRLTVVLDNTDRLLDTSNSSGLVYVAGGDGLPRCQVTFDLDVGGTEYRQFTGFLGPDCWPASEGRDVPTVTLLAVDGLDRSPSLSSEFWVNMWAALKPDWWIPMRHGFPVIEDGSELSNRSGDGSYALVDGMGVGVLGSVGPQSRVTIREDGYISSFALDVMPDGDEMNVTVAMEFASDELTTGQEIRLLRMITPGGGVRRWQIVIDDAGDAQITTYDAAESVVDSDTISKPGGRFDDGQRTLVSVRFTSGNTMKVAVGGYTATLTATSTVYESDLIIGPSNQDLVVHPFLLWRKALTDDEIAGFTLGLAEVVGPWFGDGYSNRIGHWYDAVGKPIDVDDTDRWHVPADDPDDAFLGATSPPATLAEALRETVGPLGAVWVDRDGYYRVRTVHALTDAYWATDYQTTIATFTDEDAALSAGEFRHAGITKRGPTLDTVINEAAISFYYISNPSPLQLQTSAITPRDDASIARYGLCRQSWDSQRYGWAGVASTADAIVARYADPRDEIDTVALDARNDAALVAWIAEDCELERSVDVIYTPHTGPAVTFADHNIQGIDLRGDASSLFAVLTLAVS